MSESNWTPGPWTIDERTPTHVEGPDYRGICSTGGYFNNAADPLALALTNEANAHLIAAAPDIAEALEGLLEWSYMTADHRPPAAKVDNPNVWDIARAALARARGES